MKKIVIILIILIGLGSIIQSCREDNIFQQVMGTVIKDDLVFKNQSDFEEFQENRYTEVIGNITILDSVTSLLPLNTLNIIRGNLLIKNTQLVTLNGLENLVVGMNSSLVKLFSVEKISIPVNLKSFP